jgi:hypothetical protein
MRYEQALITEAKNCYNKDYTVKAGYFAAVLRHCLQRYERFYEMKIIFQLPYIKWHLHILFFIHFFIPHAFA